MPQLEENYIATGKVVYFFWNLPLSSIHPQAQISAEAVECAGLQEMFWQMHDQVFLNQGEWGGNANALQILLGYGTKLGLDTTAYGKCLNDHETAQKIADDTRFATSVGIQGTPFFVINSQGRLFAVNGFQPYESFQQGLDSLLAPESP